MELYKKHRPADFDQLVGNAAASAMLEGFIARKSVPHTILFKGPSGCGKTTAARILRDRLGCHKVDFAEINAADHNGVDTIREIGTKMVLSPLSGPVRVWIVDECHQLTKPAQSAFLKILEDTPSHVYFFLATTDPNKLLKTILTRCTEVEMESLTKPQLLGLVNRTAKAEDFTVPATIARQIVEACDGSARKALVILDQVWGADEEEASAIIRKADSKRQAIELARALMGGASWGVVSELLRNITEDPEGLRYLVLGYARAVLIKSSGAKATRAYVIIEAFRDNFYDSKAAGLAAACFEVTTNP